MTTALQLSGLRKDFGKTKIIQGVDLEVKAGSRHALIGPNGAGKSTLFHLISGRLAPTAGSIRLFGEDITGLPPHKIRRRGLSRSFQISQLFHKLSVLENLQCALLQSQAYTTSFWWRINEKHQLNEKVEEVLEKIGLKARANVLAGLLTYAEQRALEIGLAACGDSQVLLLDEPTSGMSKSETENAIDLIRTLAVNKTLIMVEHDMGVVFELATTITVLVYGSVLATGDPRQIKENPAVQAAYLGNSVGNNNDA